MLFGFFAKRCRHWRRFTC